MFCVVSVFVSAIKYWLDARQRGRNEPAFSLPASEVRGDAGRLFL